MWPTPQDYNEAIQNPDLCFGDAELRTCIAEVNHLGLPKPRSGSFASVYHMNGRLGTWAVRCFLHNFPDQGSRYEQISSFMQENPLPYIVPFEFIGRGIRVHGHWYPILKMDWIDGDAFIPWVERHLGSAPSLRELNENFHGMCRALRSVSMAHGDLQHGNLLVVNNELRLVDYDAIFVPELASWRSNELGHRHYQHPLRDSSHFDARLDNFSAWSIATSLFCLERDWRLWEKLGAGDDCLLFKQEDYEQPAESVAFRALENHDSEEVRRAAQRFRAMLAVAPEAVPFLGSTEFDMVELESLPPPLVVPDWIQEAQNDAGPIETSEPHSGDRIDFMQAEIPNLRLIAKQSIVAEAPPRLVLASTAASASSKTSNSPSSASSPQQKRKTQAAGLPLAVKQAAQSAGAGSTRARNLAALALGAGLVLCIGAYAMFTHSWQQSPSGPPSQFEGYYATTMPMPEPLENSGKQVGYQVYTAGMKALKERRFAEAKTELLRALNIYKSIDSASVETAICYMRLGQCELSMHNPKAALGDLLPAAELLDKNNVLVQQLYSDIARCYQQLEHPDQAASYFSRALETAESYGDQLATSSLKNKLRSLSFELLSKADQAGLDYFQRVELPNEAGEKPPNVASDLRELSTIAAMLERQSKLAFAYDVRMLQFETANTYPDSHYTGSLEALQGLRHNALLRHAHKDVLAYEGQIKALQKSNMQKSGKRPS